VTERWINRDAIEWVAYEAEGVAAEHIPIYLVVAWHTGDDGRGAYPARSTVSLITGRSVRKVERDLATLVKDGHLLPGDPRRAVHIRADRRPNVYDLPEPYRLWLAARGVSVTPRALSTGASGRRPVRGHGASGATERGVRSDRTGRQADAQTGPEKDQNSGRGGAQPSATPPAPANNAAGARCRECGNDVSSLYHQRVCQLGRAGEDAA
jgi:hypothetical protein